MPAAVAQENTVDQIALGRDLAAHLDAESLDGGLSRNERVFEACGPGFNERALYFDSERRARLYVLIGGSGDSTRVVRYYYDVGSQLRAVHIRSRAVNGTLEEERRYYEPGGREIHSEVVAVSGPGWAWGEVPIVRAPIEDFESVSPCEAEQVELLQASGLN